MARGSDHFSVSDFPDALDLTQVFLTWELPIDHAQLAQLLHIQLERPACPRNASKNRSPHLEQHFPRVGLHESVDSEATDRPQADNGTRRQHRAQ